MLPVQGKRAYSFAVYECDSKHLLDAGAQKLVGKKAEFKSDKSEDI